jgi:competence protein ComEC
LRDYSFLYFCLVFIAGIISKKLIPITPLYLLLCLIFLILILIVINRKNQFNSKSLVQTIILYVIVFLTGSFIAIVGTNEIQSPLLKYQKEKNAKLFAKVDEIELQKSYEIEFLVTTDSIIFDNKCFITKDHILCKFRGDSLQRENLYENLKPGNKVFITGTFQKGRGKRNPGEFDYNKYLLSKGIVGLFISYAIDSINVIDKNTDYFASNLFEVRKRIDKIIHDLNQPQTAGLLRGLLLADRTEIDYETKSNFINSGVIHVLAVSGLHVGYILLIMIFLFGRFGIYARSLLTIIGLLAFMFITGVPPSVFRATLMAIILIIAYLFNRSTNIVNSLAIAAFLILIINPNEIYNPGFQLSFAAVLSIGLIYPKFQKSISKLKIKSKWIEYILLFLAVSLSAQIGTIPFTLAYFSKLSVIALFANLVVIPLVGVIIGIAFITIVVGIISYPIAIYFAAANDMITNIMFHFIKLTGQLDFSFLWIRNYSLYHSIIFYLAIIFLFVFLERFIKKYTKLIVILIAVIFVTVFSRFDDKKLLEDNKLSMLMIDVGQGDSFLLKFPNGKTALIDAGEANAYFDNGERVIIPLLDYLNINEIDYGFISHLDLDHYGGFISILQEGRIKQIYRPKPDSSEKSVRLENYLNSLNLKRNYYYQSKISIGKVNIFILNDLNSNYFENLSSNDRSGILKVVFNKSSFLFVGDAEIPAENYYLSKYGDFLDSDVLKVGHHGSKTGSSEEFLEVVSPKISLISAGIANKFGHPSIEILQRLSNLGSIILRTDSSGAILLQSDGEIIKQVDWRNFF